MFDNIKDKMKNLAYFISISGIILSFIYGFVLMVGGSVLNGLIYIVIGSLVSWFSSFFIFAFGELLEKIEKLISLQIEQRELQTLFKNNDINTNKETYDHTKNHAVQNDIVANNTIANENEPIKLNNATIKCPKCETIQRSDRTVCWKCGNKFIV